MILPHLESSPYALIALQLTCKSWYLTLCTGRNMDADWQRRCQKLDHRCRARNRQTFRASWVVQIKSRCMICADWGHERVGRIVDRSFSPIWAKVCKRCILQAGHPFSCTADVGGIAEINLMELPSILLSQRVTHPARDHRAIRLYLQLTIDTLLEEMVAQERARMDAVLTQYEGDRQELEAALTLKGITQDESPLLAQLAEDLLSGRPTTSEALTGIVEWYRSITERKSDVDAAGIPSAIALDSRWYVHPSRYYTTRPATTSHNETTSCT